MNFLLVYDAANEPSDLTFVVFALVACMVSGALAFYRPVQNRLWGEEKAWRGRRIGKLAFGFGLMLLAIGLFTIFVSDENLRKASKQNACTSIVGVVTDFEPQTPGEHERFTINGEPFSYSQYQITGAFNQTIAEGGPIHEGVTVRLCYVAPENVRSNLILRVEIAS